MGMGLANAQLFLELKHSGKLKNVKKIAELGSQEIHIKQKDLSNLVLFSMHPGDFILIRTSDLFLIL